MKQYFSIIIQLIDCYELTTKSHYFTTSSNRHNLFKKVITLSDYTIFYGIQNIIYNDIHRVYFCMVRYKGKPALEFKFLLGNGC